MWSQVKLFFSLSQFLRKFVDAPDDATLSSNDSNQLEETLDDTDSTDSSFQMSNVQKLQGGQNKEF